MIQIIKYNGKIGQVVSDYYDRKIKKFLPMKYGSYYSKDLETIDETKIEEITFQDKLYFIKTEFVWGRVVNIHTIAEYQIIEYKSKHDNGEIQFHPYINFTDLNRSCDSLDMALVVAMSIKYDGINTKAHYYFEKMIGQDICKESFTYYYDNLQSQG